MSLCPLFRLWIASIPKLRYLKSQKVLEKHSSLLLMFLNNLFYQLQFYLNLNNIISLQYMQSTN